jgi:hypothetical protein
MSKLPRQNEDHYLGDGLYARFDGFQIILRAPREYSDHYVGLEPAVFQELIRWIKSFSGLSAHMRL